MKITELERHKRLVHLNQRLISTTTSQIRFSEDRIEELTEELGLFDIELQLFAQRN